jgi:hypothetical protein
VHHAVDAVANPHGLLVALDVDVAGLLLDGLQQDPVAEAHDGRVFAGALELEHVALLFFGVDDVDVLGPEVAEERVDVEGLLREQPLDRLEQRGLARDDGLDVVASERADVVDRVEVRRVRHRDDERVARARNRQDAIALAHLLRDELHDLDLELHRVQVHRRDAVLLREKVRDLAVRDVPELGQGIPEVLTALALLVLRRA